MLLVDAIEVGFALESGQSDQLGAMFQAGQHDGNHAVNVEKRQHANVHFLERVRQTAWSGDCQSGCTGMDHLLNIGRYIGMGQHDALRQSSCATINQIIY